MSDARRSFVLRIAASSCCVSSYPFGRPNDSDIPHTPLLSLPSFFRFPVSTIMNVPTLCFRLGDSQQESPSHPKDDGRVSSINTSSMFASSTLHHTHCIVDNPTNTNTIDNCGNDGRPKKIRWTKEVRMQLSLDLNCSTVL